MFPLPSILLVAHSLCRTKVLSALNIPLTFQDYSIISEGGGCSESGFPGLGLVIGRKCTFCPQNLYLHSFIAIFGLPARVDAWGSLLENNHLAPVFMNILCLPHFLQGLFSLIYCSSWFLGSDSTFPLLKSQGKNLVNSLSLKNTYHVSLCMGQGGDCILTKYKVYHA